MLQFIIGIIIGGIVGFLVCAVLSVNSDEQESKQPTPRTRKTGDSDVRSK